MKESVRPEHADDTRTALSGASLRRAFLDHVFHTQGKLPGHASQNDLYQAAAHTVRDRLVQRWISTAEAYLGQPSRTVAYLSAEFLMGPHLGNNLINLGIFDEVREAMAAAGLDLDRILEQEVEPGLGNGGLGRLAACFMDSLATLEIPALGYGIRYEYGIFQQTIIDGMQVESTDTWLRNGNPWEIQRSEWAVQVRLGGHTEHYTDDRGHYRVRWVPAKTVVGVPFDSPILGYRVNTVNTLRLWRADATEAFDFHTFNRGDYLGAVSKKVTSENLTKVLYPNDETSQGKELRLEQQYFFVACSLQDMLRLLAVDGIPVTRFHEKFAVQLNDTHPAVGIAELMRLLVDDHDLPWNEAWHITQNAFAYTNHTLLPEALEQWPLPLFARVLPRHLEIILEINARLLDEVRIRFYGDESRLARLSLISEYGEKQVRMANLACVGSHAINGVAELHSRLMREDVLKDFYEMWPEKFTSITNGVTPRRWLALSNPRLTRLVSEAIGDGWISDLAQLRALEPYAEDAGFREQWQAARHQNKVALAELVRETTGVVVDPSSMFDVMVKRIHEYKRQHLAVLHVIALYHRIKSDPGTEIQPRTFLFGGKAAPGYAYAKLMIRFITSVADVVNRDPQVRDRLKVVFLPNFNVTYGQRIYPAADLAEQISLAGKEASGTGNMKFAMNGALNIGTMDGANIELREAVGNDNFFPFGLTAPEVYGLRASGYDPAAYYHSNPQLRAVIDLVQQGFFSRGDPGLFRPLFDPQQRHDPYLLMADFASYIECQEKVSQAFAEPARWQRMSVLSCARSGRFSSDRAIREYCERIWHIEPVPVRLLHRASGAPWQVESPAHAPRAA
ncbi:Glucan phosphorylase [Cupriavidus necator]|uniref:Alpha-1,4 glucan phosphorylase n=1 Tax=Cupriavidus necator (strain ATCC 17699 / DSM 428 / KCTC 22496 / NCIMB 10442 / H16 / Stanier 337) TaxID=381666 RepID=Q0K0X5_CUPNH|nr:glycogen/starch/alpha-glucan phosphorylase [Cupriavidus necator]KUE90114.1 maltodextrin phosphorylase [Cupriavidus necator]QCC04189.1 glycogen/starch/alpha-glucan phosphorylase [Cupriavidus necator H16]QQB78877.1 glycogen/starch/alpha-glucan phosphorylase [Cupriavidus necator]WKA43095.1 glycogen/starch/alpha-glucan phosphorylase [Cupriavidus necator]CAJ96349.1 glucan phosphorylase [Cupriavidus necator H16]